MLLQASIKLSNSHLSIAYLCLDCFLILSINSKDHSGLGRGLVLILKGSEAIQFAISFKYAVNIGREIKSFVLTIPLNCPLMISASSFQRVKAIIVPTFPKIASLTSSCN